MRTKIYLTILLAIPLSLMAQETVYSLNQYTPLNYNPGYSVLDYEAGLSLFHEEYTIGAGDYITSNSLNVDYPIIKKETGRRLLGIGFSAFNKDAGASDLLNAYNLGLSVATPVQIANRHFLNFGAGANYVNKRTSLESLSTGSQWIASEFRYDPNAALGESFAIQNINYVSLSTGISWVFQTDRFRQTLVSVSAYDLNQPTESFFEGTDKLPVKWIAFAETILYENHRIQITPSFYYINRGVTNSYKAFVSTKLLFENNNPYDVIKTGNIDFQMSYGMSGDAAASIILNQPGFSAGFSYNFPVTQQNQYLQSVVQVGVSLTKTLWKPKPKTIVIESAPSTRSFDFDRKREVVTVEKSELDQIRDQLNQLDNIKSLQFELQKDFKFEFNSSKVDPSSYPFLDDLSDLLNENEEFSLQVIGHTDNVGSKNANYSVSSQRAEVVANYLIEKGISPDRISSIGRGDTEPISDNASEDGKARNRRVEFIIRVDR